MSSLASNSRLAVCVLLASLTSVFSQSQPHQTGLADKKPSLAEITALPSTGSLNINHLWLRIRNDGMVGYDSSKGWGLTYPFQYGNVLYADNLMWVGKVYDGQLPTTFMRMPELRAGGGAYSAGVRPGSIIRKGVAEDPESGAVRVFRYRPDYLTADLSVDVAAMKGIAISAVTPAMIATMRDSYARDLGEWPWQKGAPFLDRNNNGRMDSGEPPGLENAGQVVWFSYNDLDESLCKSFAGDIPIGIEVQVTLWGYKGIPNLDDIVFKRYRLIYKGTSAAAADSRIDSLYLTQWVDPDIGNGSNDLGGCDSVLGLAYAYNALYELNDQDGVYRALNLSTPGLGYALLQGPLVEGEPNETGMLGFKLREGKRNIPLSSCLVHMTGLADGLSVPRGIRDFYAWNVARGFSGQGSLDPHTIPYLDHLRQPSKFMYYGDPASGTGWVASRPRNEWYVNPNLVDFRYPGGDTRLHMNMGPISVALGDTQEAVIAMIASHAPSAVENVTWLKNLAKYVQAIYPNLGDYVAGFVTSVDGNSGIPVAFQLEQNYPNPFNPVTHIRFTIPLSGDVRLSVFDLLGQEIRVLTNSSLPAGEHVLSWDGLNALGNAAPSGVYFYRLMQGNRQATRKLILLR